MQLNELLGIGDFMLVESSYAEQRWIPKTLDYMRKVKRADVDELLRIYNESSALIGIAIHDRGLGFWIVFTDFIAGRREIEEFNALTADIGGDREREVEVKWLSLIHI